MKKLLHFISLLLLSVTLSAPQAGPLHEAAKAGKLKQVRQLIGKGADPNEVDFFGFSPLLLAQLNDHDQTARFLASKGARDQLNPLVRRLQFYLSELGYSTNGIDGLLGTGTREAIRAFQRDHDFKITGRVKEDWVRKLYNAMQSRVQTDLNKLGFYGGSIDGLMGSGTRDAIRAFRKQAGLPVNNAIEPELTQALRSALQRQASTTAASHRADDSKTLQENLQVLGFNPGVPDGIVGSATQQAIRDFQSRHQLTVTGQVNGEWRAVLERELLRAIQTQLADHGFEPGPADGEFGPQTEQAIRNFQKQIRLPVNGQASAQLLSALQKNTPKQQPDQQAITARQSAQQRDRVERAQRRLQALDFKISTIDGELGSETGAAVKQFQQQQRLPVDGQISEQLISALDKALQERQAAATQERVEPSAPSTNIAIEPKPSTTDTAPATTDTPPALSEQALIAELQSRLNSLGYDAGPTDGEIGPRTQSAIRAFQNQLKLTVNGQPSLALLNTIKSTPLDKARAVTPKKTASGKSKGKNTEVRGRLVLQKSSNGTLVGCSISGVQLDPSWCRPFAARNNTKDCKAIIRSTSKVLLVKCG